MTIPIHVCLPPQTIHRRLQDAEGKLLAERRHFAANEGTGRQMPYALAEAERSAAMWRLEYGLALAAYDAETAARTLEGAVP